MFSPCFNISILAQVSFQNTPVRVYPFIQEHLSEVDQTVAYSQYWSWHCSVGVFFNTQSRFVALFGYAQVYHSLQEHFVLEEECEFNQQVNIELL